MNTLNPKKNRTSQTRRRMFQIGMLFVGTVSVMIILKNSENSLGGYFSTAEGNASARVARYDVELGELILVSEDNVLDLSNENDEVKYFIEILNYSETEVEYTLEITGLQTEAIECEYENAEGRLDALNGSSGATFSLKMKESGELLQDTVLENLKIRVTAVQPAGGEN